MPNKFIAKLLILTFLLPIISAFYMPSKACALEVGSESVLLFDLNTENTIYSKNGDEQLYPASITKIMTCILTLENSSLDEIVTVDSKTPYNIYGSNIALKPGENISVEDLLYALMLPSANDAAEALAVYISGSEEAFVKLMNEKADELGMDRTNYVNPHGLHDDNHYTTANDMKKLVIYAMKNTTFRKVVSTSHYTIAKTDKTEERPLVTSNNLLYNYLGNKCIVDKQYVDREYEGCLGIKNGYTDQASCTLVGYVKKGDLDLVCIVMKGLGNTVYGDAHNLFDYGFDNFHKQNIIAANEYVTELEVTDVNGKQLLIPIVTKKSVSIIHRQEAMEVLEQNIIYDDLSFPIEKGDRVGVLQYKRDGEIIASTDIVSTVNIETASNVKSQSKTSNISIGEGSDDIVLNDKSSVVKSSDNTKITMQKIIKMILMSSLIILLTLLLIRHHNLNKRKKIKAELRRKAREEYNRELREKKSKENNWI